MTDAVDDIDVEDDGVRLGAIGKTNLEGDALGEGLSTVHSSRKAS